MERKTIENHCVKMFLPPDYVKSDYDISQIDDITGKHFQYAAKGRLAICHILESLNICKKLALISPYMCPTVLQALENMNYEVKYFDINLKDLNPDCKSIENMINKYHPSVVICASLYGNPCNLTEIEKICKENNVYLIDDAAQSFGTKLNGKYVGTFGNGGFFAFSPGKATSGHMGAYFWTSNQEYSIDRTHHFFVHYINFINYTYNRKNIYKKRNKYLSLLLTFLNQWVSKTNIINDDICCFEKVHLGGILKCLLEGAFDFRKDVYLNFVENIPQNDDFSVISSQQGEAMPNKIVLRFNKKEKANCFRTFLKSKKIFCYSGYNMLTTDFEELPNCKSIVGSIVELPIENNSQRMNYLIDSVKEFLEN